MGAIQRPPREVPKYLRWRGTSLRSRGRRPEPTSCSPGRELGERASFLAGDMTDPQQRRHLVEYVQERHGRLDVLVNNAGACDDGALQDQSLDDMTSVIELSLTANLDLCRLAAPML